MLLFNVIDNINLIFMFDVINVVNVSCLFILLFVYDDRCFKVTYVYFKRFYQPKKVLPLSK